MPYSSDRQRRYFHTAAARKKGITKEMVDEYDDASRGKDLPERKKKAKDNKKKRNLKKLPLARRY